MKVLLYIIASYAILLAQSCTVQQPEKTYLVVGSYTNNSLDTGIYVFQFDETNGELALKSTVPNTLNPSFLTASQNGNLIYACSDTDDSTKALITAYGFDAKSATLKVVNSVSSRGQNPVFVSLPTTDNYVATGNYTSGSAAVIALDEAGMLTNNAISIQFRGSGPVTDRQEKSHIHSAYFSPDNNYLLFPDLGSDRIWVLQFHPDSHPMFHHDSTLDIQAIPGSGPRHLAFHPSGKWLYNVEELSGMVTQYSFENGKSQRLQRSFAYSKRQEVYNSADIHFSSDGKFLYVSNRWDGENSIAIFAVDGASGNVTLVGHQSTLGEHPRNFALSPSGKYLLVANMHSNEIVVFKRDAETGLLTPTPKRYHLASPSCLQFIVH